MVTSKAKYQYCRENGLCYTCGERAEPGKSRCLRCLQIEAAKEKIRRDEKGDDYRRARAEYIKNWQENNPDKMEVYKGRKSEYNRRYRNGGF